MAQYLDDLDFDERTNHPATGVSQNSRPKIDFFNQRHNGGGGSNVGVPNGPNEY